MPILGIEQTEKELMAELKALEDQALATLKSGVRLGFETLLSATPVWTGETVANYHVSVGEESEGSHRAPIENGPTGATNKMALGSEPRRAANEDVARLGMVAALGGMQKLADVSITNTVDDAKWDMIDNGAAPGGPPGKPLGSGQQLRAPGGVSRVAEQTVRSTGDWE